MARYEKKINGTAEYFVEKSTKNNKNQRKKKIKEKKRVATARINNNV